MTCHHQPPVSGGQTEPDLMTATEVADYFSIPENTVYKYAAKGRMPALRVGKVWRFDKKAVDRWVCGKWNADAADHEPHE